MNIERWVQRPFVLRHRALAWGYTAPIAYDPIGPRPYPMLICHVALGCIYLVVRPSTLTCPQVRLHQSHFEKHRLVHGFFIGLCTHFELLGFPLATALMAFGVGKLFGGSSKACHSFPASRWAHIFIVLFTTWQ